MQARKFTLLPLFLAFALAWLGSTGTGEAYSVPTSFTLSGYLVDQYGSPVTYTASMKFSLMIGGNDVWDATYNTVNVVGGSFTVHLGMNEPGVQGTVQPITPALLSQVTDQTPVTVHVQISNGETYEALSPDIPVTSALFALRAETIAGYDSTMLAKQDDDGNILSEDGTPVISSGGQWLGGSAPAGPVGPTGATGADGANGTNGQGFNFAGPFDPNSEGYNPYDVVTYDGSVFVVTPYGDPDPFQDTPESDIANGYGNWAIFAQGFGYEGPWQSGQTYYPNEVVLYNGSLYVTGTGISSNDVGTAPTQDSNWSLFTQGFNPLGPFDPTATNSLGDVVSYGSASSGTGSYVYISQTPSVSGANTPDINSAWALFASAGPAGAAGQNGLDGMDGATGPMGPTGATGQDGQPGPTGATGATGPQGPPGSGGSNKGPAGPPGAQGPAGPPTLAGARWVPLSMHATSLTAVAGTNLSPSGTASGNAQPDAYYIQLKSAGGAKKYAGEIGPFYQTQSRYHPILTALIRTGSSSIATQRIWVAISAADLSQTDGVNNIATPYVGLRYSTAAGDTDWMLASGDGTSGSVQDTGIPVQPDTAYLMQINWSVDGQLTCLINNISCATKTTNLYSGAPVNMGVDCVTTTLGSPSVFQNTAYISLKYDGNNF